MGAASATDGPLARPEFTVLADDQHYFPPYEAVVLARRDTLERLPAMREVLQKLSGAISTEEMRNLNYKVDGDKRTPAEVVREWLKARG